MDERNLADHLDISLISSLYLSRPQQLERGLAVAKKLFEFVDRHDLDYMEVRSKLT